MFMNPANRTSDATWSRSGASARTTCGLLPPHSRRDLLEVAFGGVLEEQPADLGRAGECDLVDVHVPPERLHPLSHPSPGTTLRTPSGSPASAASSAMRIAD